MVCPGCGKNVEGLKCSCGVDFSRDFTHYPTLTEIRAEDLDLCPEYLFIQKNKRSEPDAPAPDFLRMEIRDA